jgi:hypothetical protein
MSKIPHRKIITLIHYNDTIVSLPLLIMKNQEFSFVLDSIITLNNRCIHVVMEERTWFNIYGIKINDTLKIGVRANQYDLSDQTDGINSKYYGNFYYKNHLFIVANKNHLLDFLFEKIEKQNKIITYYPDAIIYCYKPYKDYLPLIQSSSLSCNYINNKFFITESRSTCEEYYPVYHKIKRGETLEKIAKIYWVKPEKIMQLNNLTEPVLPKKGVIQIQ